MTALTTKQRASINAALATIHVSGHDVAALQQQVRSATARGKPAYAAYKAVLGSFAKASPDIAPILIQTDRLIEASDDATVERYDKALTAFIQTGDETHVNALEGMVRADSIALAVRDGHLSSEDAAAGRVDWGSLGLTPPAPTGAPAKFSFSGTGPAQPAPTNPAAPATARPPGGHGSRFYGPAQASGRSFGFAQVQPGGGGIAERRARLEAMPDYGRASPYAGMAPAQIKEAMRADYQSQGWQREAAE